MNKKKIYLITQSFLCVFLAVLMAAAVIGICREGLLLKEEDPLEWIFTREKFLAWFRPILPLLVVSLAMTAVGLVFNIRDGRDTGPAKNAGIDADAAKLQTGAVNAKPEINVDAAKLQTGADTAKLQIDADTAKRNENRQPGMVPGMVLILRAALLAAAVVFIAIGIINGSAYDVFSKAVNICTECVGLG